MSGIDRALQREYLAAIVEAYPRETIASQIGAFHNDERLVINISYLRDHGLVEAAIKTSSDGSQSMSVGKMRATVKGIDFLADDGGLSALLGVVTVRFDTDTLKAIIGNHVDASSIPPEEKSKIRKWLEIAGTEGLKEATKRLVAAGIDYSPQIWQMLQSIST